MSDAEAAEPAETAEAGEYEFMVGVALGCQHIVGVVICGRLS